MKGRGLAVAQGVFYVATGLWPLVHLPSFEAVSGPKREKWLVKTMGVLIAAVGGSLLLSRRPNASLGFLSASALALCDLVYVGKRRIAPTYLLDAAVEGVVAAGWIAVAVEARKGRGDGLASFIEWCTSGARRHSGETMNATSPVQGNEKKSDLSSPTLDEAWFDEAPQSQRRSSTPPPVKVGEFLGDELADSWLR